MNGFQALVSRINELSGEENRYRWESLSELATIARTLACVVAGDSPILLPVPTVEDAPLPPVAPAETESPIPIIVDETPPEAEEPGDAVPPVPVVDEYDPFGGDQ